MNAGVFDRATSLERLKQPEQIWDVAIIGGGATGVGVALDAASRGLSVVLFERYDFGKGTSSRSTKLVHGGVRYLQQGNLTLVRDALRERTLLRENAPHLVHDLAFIIPCRSLWERFFYGTGLKLYDALAGGHSFGRSRQVTRGQLRQTISGLKQEPFRGGVIYHDGQFDDSRLLIAMARTAAEHGACLLNYADVTALEQDNNGRLVGLKAVDRETSNELRVRAKCIVNAAGPFCDAVRRMDESGCSDILAVSQGVHIVLPSSFLLGDTAIIVPKTSDGRVIFIIPWLGHALVGTTDTAIDAATAEPRATADEIEFLLSTAGEYLVNRPQLSDVLSVWTGIRPLVKGDRSARTASLSRDHVIRTSPSGLMTITGGKWTTVRKMAEDCVDQIYEQLGRAKAACRTRSLRLHGYASGVSPTDSRAGYGSELRDIQRLESERPDFAVSLHPALPIRGSDVVWATRHEMARTVEDVLARRTRALFLNAAAAIEMAPRVAALMAGELGKDAAWITRELATFNDLAAIYNPAESKKGVRDL